MSSIVEKGPENITVEGLKIPAWLIDVRAIALNLRGAQLDTDGGFELSELRADQCTLAPGVLYQRTDTNQGEKGVFSNEKQC